MRRIDRVIVACCLLFAIGVGTLFVTQVHAAAAPSLLHNDERWYRDGTARLEVVGGIFYVPVDLFGALPSMEVSIDSRRGEFIVYERNGKRYISALYDEKMATVNGEQEVYLNFYKLHGGYFYVPVEYFCEVLGLTCELKASSSTPYGVSLRISDGAQTKTMEELLSVYDPVATEPPPTSFVPPVTSDTTPPVTTTDRENVRRTYRFTFNTLSADSFPNLLTVLEETGIPAAFCITEEELVAHPDRVTAIVAAGHTVALRIENDPDAAALLAKVEHANDVFCRITKSTTRLIQPLDAEGFGEAAMEMLEEAGYVVWSWTYDVPDSVGYALSYVETLCRSAMQRRVNTVLRMSCNDTVVRLLPWLQAFIEENPLYSMLRITSTDSPIS